MMLRLQLKQEDEREFIGVLLNLPHVERIEKNNGIFLIESSTPDNVFDCIQHLHYQICIPFTEHFMRPHQSSVW